ncbi:MAG TPA: AraC family transcriptional regulator [Rhodopseudomonas sp.]|uniref:helix-turn-helix transcriptional regulator n=1 Tax=Rhodopseudomonas sp. TaxID=1078 RepID=UPI002ED8D4F0
MQREGERFPLFSGAMVVSAGITQFDQPKRVNAELAAGVKTVMLLSGRLRIRIGDAGEREICGPAVLMIRSLRGGQRDQVFAADVPVRYVIVQLDEKLLGSEIAAAFDRSPLQASGGSAPGAVLLSSSAGNDLQAVAAQIMNCPIRGVERELYLGGKAMQLVALALSSCISDADDHDGHQFSSKDVDRIRQARDLLVGAMRNPPSLDSLAQQTGLNVRKLNLGFRRIYRSTAYGFLQEYRLEQAYKLISSGEMSVSEAAYHVGYGAAHFATVFRKRFGVSPSSLR